MGLFGGSKKNTNNYQKVIDYFCGTKGGCLSKTISDEEYLKMLREKRDSMDFREMALNKIGLDEDQVNEIPPVKFEGFVYNNAYGKQTAKGRWVSSAYQVSWLFFSSTQVYVYRYTFWMHQNAFAESTDEIFYKDVTSLSTRSETETLQLVGNRTAEIITNKLCMVVPGDQLFISMDGIADADSIIQAMKQKLREKKM